MKTPASAPAHVFSRRLAVVVLLVAILAVTGATSRLLMTTTATPGRGPQGTASRPAAPSRAPTRTTPGGTVIPAVTGPSHLAAGSDPTVLPGPIMIADKLNNRLLIIDPHGRILWQFPRPGDLTAAQSFKIPDDAFFTPDGRQIIATEEDDQVIRVIDISSHRIVYSYGTPGVPGSGPNQLDNPDDAMMSPNGDIYAPDIKNCRIIMIAKGAHTVSRQLGETGTCVHGPPQTFGSPNGVFPMSNGSYLVTEINGSWVSQMSLSGQVAWTAHLPLVAYPSDSNQISQDRYLTVDYSSPGQIVIFDHTGKVFWQYAPSGNNALDKPSLALPLPNGDVLANDDANHRVIVVDPRTDRVVWQYGHTHVAGSDPGYLNNPDGVDLYPPHSLLTAGAISASGPR